MATKRTKKRTTRKASRKSGTTKKAAKKTAVMGKPDSASTLRRASASRSVTPAQEAQQITWLILGELKSTQIKHLRVGKLLCDIRDRKLYVELKFTDMESYAWARLHLRRAAYYQYTQVYDWVAISHKEWLVPHPKGFIPDLNDVTDLIWIETELKRTDLDSGMRATLESLRKKALSGTLKYGELDKVRRKQQNATKDAFKSMLSRVRGARNYGKKLASMPAEVLVHLEAAISLLQKAFDDERAGKTQKS